MRFIGHTDELRKVTFSPDGKYVLTASLDKTAKLWDVNTGNVLQTFTGHTAQVNSVAFSPDGKYVLTGSRDKTARLWDVQSGNKVREFTGHTDTITKVGFSLDGTYVLTASLDGTARIWDVRTGQQIHSFDTHSGVYWADFSPDASMSQPAVPTELHGCGMHRLGWSCANSLATMILWLLWLSHLTGSTWRLEVLTKR